MIVYSIVALSVRIAPFGRFRRLCFGLGSWVVSPPISGPFPQPQWAWCCLCLCSCASGFSCFWPCDEVTVGCCPVRSWDCRLRVVSAFGLCADSTRARGLCSVSFPGLKGFLPQGFLHRASVTVGVVLSLASAFPLSRYARALYVQTARAHAASVLVRFVF